VRINIDVTRDMEFLGPIHEVQNEDASVGPSILALALLSLTPVHGSGPDRVGHYDFSYQAGDNSPAAGV
jgi:hypothetical protein